MKTKTKLIAKIIAFAGVIMMLFALAIPCFASDETSAAGDSDAPYETFYTIFQTTDGSSKGIPLNQNKNTSYEDEFLSFNLNAGTVINEEYKYFQQSFDIQFKQAVDTIIFRSGDFYLWNSIDDENANVTNTLCVDFYIYPEYENYDAYEISVKMTYNIVGQEDDVKTYVDSSNWRYGTFCLSNAIDEIAYDSDAPLYIHSIEMTYKFPATDNVHIDILTTPKSHADKVNLPIVEDDITLTDFSYLTRWIATATSGFLDAELVPGITFGGILTVIIAFSVVLMLLKMFR